jgi:hypothetical protein
LKIPRIFLRAARDNQGLLRRALGFYASPQLNTLRLLRRGLRKNSNGGNLQSLSICPACGAEVLSDVERIAGAALARLRSLLDVKEQV